MEKINKVKIKINGKKCTINPKMTLKEVMVRFKIPLDKVAIELNQNNIDRKKINKIKVKNNDKIEIVHFIGGG